MAQAYSNPERVHDSYALPDVEVFHLMGSDVEQFETFGDGVTEGWYWWSCFPACLPDGDPVGPFATEAEALADAQNI